MMFSLIPSLPLFQGRIVGTMGNPNFLAGYLAMALPFLFVWKQSIPIKAFLLTMIFVTIVLSDSRSGMIAAAVVSSIFLLLHLKKSKLLFTLTILIILTGTFFVLTKTSFLARNSYWDNRFIIWQEGIQAVVNRPILGYGQENFELIFPPERHIKIDSAHNIFLEVAVASGLVGLLLFVAILAVAFKKGDTTIRLSLLAFLIVAQFNPLSIAQLALFWSLLGMSYIQKIK